MIRTGTTTERSSNLRLPRCLQVAREDGTRAVVQGDIPENLAAPAASLRADRVNEQCRAAEPLPPHIADHGLAKLAQEEPGFEPQRD